MIQSDHNPSALLDVTAIRDLPPVVPSVRHRRRRLHSREAARARVRVGLIIGLATLLLMLIIVKWSLEALQLDIGALMKAVVLFAGAVAALYFLALIIIVATVRRRRAIALRGMDDAASRTGVA